jgi:hypothetical protein
MRFYIISNQKKVTWKDVVSLVLNFIADFTDHSSVTQSYSVQIRTTNEFNSATGKSRLQGLHLPFTGAGFDVASFPGSSTQESQYKLLQQYLFDSSYELAVSCPSHIQD